mmetsp:Transcript_10831/g.26457  ORF Transcript_10831/g.26457 Transcript_10831/m.26457 type:complete len:493 (+) Transcript_10831:358-1836(+)
MEQAAPARSVEVPPLLEQPPYSTLQPQFFGRCVHEVLERHQRGHVRVRVLQRGHHVGEGRHRQLADDLGERRVQQLAHLLVCVVLLLHLGKDGHGLRLGHEVRHHLEVDEPHEVLVEVQRGVQVLHRPPRDLERGGAVQLQRGVMRVHPLEHLLPHAHLVHGGAAQQLVQLRLRLHLLGQRVGQHVHLQQRLVRHSRRGRLGKAQVGGLIQRLLELLEVDLEVPGDVGHHLPLLLGVQPAVDAREDGVHVRHADGVVQQPAVSDEALETQRGHLVHPVLVLGHHGAFAEGRAAEAAALAAEHAVLGVRLEDVQQLGVDGLHAFALRGLAHLLQPRDALRLLFGQRHLLGLLAHEQHGVVAAGLAAHHRGLLGVLGVVAVENVVRVPPRAVQLHVHRHLIIQREVLEERRERSHHGELLQHVVQGLHGCRGGERRRGEEDRGSARRKLQQVCPEKKQRRFFRFDMGGPLQSVWDINGPRLHARARRPTRAEHL